VEQALAMAGSRTRRARGVATLSGGQRQRLYFALAVGGNPEALFLDEPTVGMDIEARRAFVAGIQALRGAGKSVIFTTHYLREAEELATRIVVIDRGGTGVIADSDAARASWRGWRASALSFHGGRAPARRRLCGAGESPRSTCPTAA
jgi:ABC-2 type transport system ATP-binding protein